MRQLFRRAFRVAVLLYLVATAVAWVVCALTARHGEEVLEVAVAVDARTPATAAPLTVCTVNLHHGRAARGFAEVLRGPGVFEANLDAVGDLLIREGVDVCALQEVDGPSWWSHGIDQAGWLQRRGRFGFAAHGRHVDGLGLTYGTAILSTAPLSDARGVTFEPTPPSFSKGFTLASFEWPGTERKVDVVSVHVDFSRPWTRTEQMKRLRDVVRRRAAAREEGSAHVPLLVMGDFNAGWDGWFVKVRWFADELGLTTWTPEDDSMVTLPLLGWRIDWILVSDGLVIEDLRVLPDVVSDHRAVVARLRLAP